MPRRAAEAHSLLPLALGSTGSSWQLSAASLPGNCPQPVRLPCVRSGLTQRTNLHPMTSPSFLVSRWENSEEVNPALKSPHMYLGSYEAFVVIVLYGSSSLCPVLLSPFPISVAHGNPPVYKSLSHLMFSSGILSQASRRRLVLWAAFKGLGLVKEAGKQRSNNSVGW